MPRGLPPTGTRHSHELENHRERAEKAERSEIFNAAINIDKFKYLNSLKLTMAVKTITVTKAAYEALKAKKNPDESFSEAILRITTRPSLNEFYGILSPKTGERFERTIMELRKKRRKAHETRMRQIRKELSA